MAIREPLLWDGILQRTNDIITNKSLDKKNKFVLDGIGVIINNSNPRRN
jgi:hypothetical protein